MSHYVSQATANEHLHMLWINYVGCVYILMSDVVRVVAGDNEGLQVTLETLSAGPAHCKGQFYFL